jgi:hypothetical protein
MLLRAAISFLLLGPVFSASCLAGQSFIQEEGKYLNPPNLIWTENSVFAGVSLASVPRLPFSASVDCENHTTAADGNIAVRQLASHIDRDSYGRTRVLVDLNEKGSVPDPHKIQVSIYDPISKTDITLFPNDKRAILRREAGAYPIGFRSSQRIQLKQPQVGKRLPAIETKVEELPEEVIDHMRLRHGRFLTIFPARASWNEKPDRTKLDYWFSQEIQSFILIQQVGPGDSSHSVKVFDIRRHEPDAALFSIPEGYKIEEMVISDPRPQYIL